MIVRVTFAVVGAIAITAALVLIGWPAADYRHNDFAGFWTGSRLVLDGADPYDAAVLRAAFDRIGSQGYALRPAGVGYGYPLTAALLFAPFALLPISVAAAIWLVSQVTFAIAAVVYLARALFPTTLRRDLPVVLALGATSQPAWVLAVGGNVGGFVFAIAATSAGLLLRGRPATAGAVAGLLVVKPHPLLFALLLVLCAVPRRAAVRMLAGGLATSGTVVLVSLAVRPGWIAEYLVPLGALGGAPVARASVFGALMSFGALAWVAVLLILGTAAVWEWRARPALSIVIAAAIPLSLLTAPYVWSYDHLALVITVAVAVALAAGADARRRTIVLGLLVVVWTLLPWMLYAIAFRRGDEAWTFMVPIAMLAVLMFAAWSRSRVGASETRASVYGTIPS